MKTKFCVLALSLLLIFPLMGMADTITSNIAGETWTVVYTLGGGSLTITSVTGSTLGSPSKLFSVGVDGGGISAGTSGFTDPPPNDACQGGYPACDDSVVKNGGGFFPAGAFAITGD